MSFYLQHVQLAVGNYTSIDMIRLMFDSSSRRISVYGCFDKYKINMYI